MNLFNMNVTQKCLIAECWIPTADVPHIRDSLDTTSMGVGDSVAPSFLYEVGCSQIPPTYFRLNKFTHSFQMIVDSYGIATYREINPAPWTIITFPFLFAVMFGDAGHGLIMFLAALALILVENRIKPDDEVAIVKL
ncbi:unnamed protein product [Gongylonema pulchrum]|uniref:V-type proton ATPase subunit a n=1 Tax=Gongylonema pulchrum TaxID=637853 RepID=A0A183E403_9BILA|nr:unnamed protein product [Gongylonema pulchrum]